ncbi:unnamed protein product [Caenorhabditis auriculariae]|uniref:Uncharacterized protein n=1 Tax=Caenorhabditis auriculariae TaxID=2777116 RepID=A0A8S1HW42_9PELO|nr:unnamed protein product [Caenorhabditis auriculariae]
MPVLWPIFTLASVFYSDFYCLVGAPVGGTTTLYWITVPENEHVAHALDRLDVTLPALRIITTASFPVARQSPTYWVP